MSQGSQVSKVQILKWQVLRDPLPRVGNVVLGPKHVSTRRCTTVRDSEGQAIPCNGGSDGSVLVMGKWSMQWVSG